MLDNSNNLEPKYAAYLLRWVESGFGWGKRPDGISLHQSIESCNEYVRNYWNAMPDEVQDCYSRPSYADPKLVFISKELAYKIENDPGKSFRSYSSDEKSLLTWPNTH